MTFIFSTGLLNKAKTPFTRGSFTDISKSPKAILILFKLLIFYFVNYGKINTLNRFYEYIYKKYMFYIMHNKSIHS